MMLGERSAELLTSWELEFHASDISPQMLDRTSAGRYSQLEVNRGRSGELTTAHFDKAGNGWQIHDSLRSKLQLSRINLAGDWPPMPRFDLILMRNVLIYFDTETRKRVLGKLCERLQRDGCLALGDAETTLNLSDRLEPQRFDGVTFYRLTS